MTNFRVQGVGLDTTSLVCPLIGEDYDYIITSLSANNDYLLRGAVSSATLMVKTDYLDQVDVVLSTHLGILGKDKADLLLAPAEAKWDSIKELSPMVKEYGLAYPKTIEDFDKVDSALKEKGGLRYVLLSLCPLDFNVDLIGEAQKRNLTIIVDNPMGGYLSGPRNIKAFSVPYLLSFAAAYGNLVVVSGRDQSSASIDASYLKGLIGKPSGPMFELKKTIQKPIKELKKTIYTSIKVGNDLTIPYDSPEMLAENTVFGLGKSVERVELSNEDGVARDVSNLLKIIYKPSDADQTAIFAHYRLRVQDYLVGSMEGYEIDYITYGPGIVLFSAYKPEIRKGALWWYKYEAEETKYYYLIQTQNGPVFGEAKNSDENPVNP